MREDLKTNIGISAPDPEISIQDGRLWGTLAINGAGHLTIGGMDAVDLARTYGTPVIVYDEQGMRARIRAFHAAFAKTGLTYEIAYASKAFCTLAMCQLALEEGLTLDVVSGGELLTALRAGASPKQIHMHGNNKTPEELSYAVEVGIAEIIVDNETELALLNEIAAEAGKTVDILLRVAPGVEAHTHEFISTGQQDSKFGLDWENGQAQRVLETVRQWPQLRVVGLHSHIGSQIFDGRGFIKSVERVSELYAYGLSLGLPFRVFNVGGGFGIRYTDEDHPEPIEQSILTIADAVHSAFATLQVPVPKIVIEPGRSIVGDFAVTLYRAGSRKVIPGVRNYVSVDGGMTDNPRLALYGAKYDAVLANRMTDPVGAPWSVAGKCCESGDMLIWDAPLPEPRDGDILAVFCTGAYNYSMASHYNRNPNPAVVFVRDGEARVVVERETWEDLLRQDRALR